MSSAVGQRGDAPSRWPGPGASDLLRGMRGARALVRALVLLRWISLGAQAVTVLGVVAVWGAPLLLGPIFGVLAAGAVSNLVLARSAGPLGERAVGGVLLLDVALLTAVLALSGGPSNPFSALYLVHVVLAAIVGTPRVAWWVVLATSAGFAGLFFAHLPLPPVLGGHAHHGGQASYSAHLQGMWVAHALSAAAIATFVSALSRALRAEREKSERTARLLGLATLAAGAAHEIGNPLATIRVAVGELERDLAERGLSADELSDLHLIDREVGRASRVLERLAASAGELMGESPVAADLRQLIATLLERMGEQAERVRVEVETPSDPVHWPVQAVSQALLQLLRNALDASDPGERVELVAGPDRGGVRIEVRDRGRGMEPGVLERVGEPFFTTRPGAGMGLGVFIARSLVEHLGGQLRFDSARGEGTLARVWLPGGVRP